MGLYQSLKQIRSEDIIAITRVVIMAMLIIIAYYLGMYERQEILNNCVDLVNSGCRVIDGAINCSGARTIPSGVNISEMIG